MLTVCTTGALAADLTPVAPGTVYSDAFTVRAQATKLGCIVGIDTPGVAPTDPLATITVQTATSAAADDDSWLDTDASIVVTDALPVVALNVAGAILDKVRLKIVSTRMDNGGLTFTPRFLSDQTLTAA